MTRHVPTLADLGRFGILSVLDRADELKRLRGTPEHPSPLAGKSVALVFEKASTRTRLSFEVGVHELGGRPVTLISKDTQIERGEPLEDTARMLSAYVHAVVYRTHGHDRIEQLARVGTIPVINGLSDLYHPCQVLADLMTVRESMEGRLDGVRVAWVGDGNNMANSWILAAKLTGLDLVLACPSGYEPPNEVLAAANEVGEHGSVEVVRDVETAVRGADVVTTDVWASMGQEHEMERRKRAFADYCVDEKVMALAKDSAVFLHCLPAHRGEEVSARVIDGPQSRVWQEAANRLHAQKALLEWVFSH
ncbi:MAG: ornithine carbamoyltransferase [Myxococcales bacterium]|nr:ornithine carbamoyltransferase [Myxococcales bacterium]